MRQSAGRTLVSDELARRGERLLERRTKQAQFRDSQKTLDNFDFTFNKKMNRSLVFDLATLPTGKILSTAANGPGDQWLVSGWSEPEPWGVWSEGPAAQLVASFAKPSNKGLTFTAWAHGLGVHPSTTQRITVSANGLPVATWNLKEGGDSEYTAAIPPRSTPDPTILIEFDIDHPISPRQDGLGPDDRELWIDLAGFRFDEQEEK